MSKMEVVKQSDNKLLGRKEVLVQFETEGPTYTRAKAKEEIARMFKTKDDLVVVNSIKSHYGSLNVLVSANVYDKKETLERLTSRHISNRNSKRVSKEESPQASEGENENVSNEEGPQIQEDVREKGDVSSQNETSEESSDENLSESNDNGDDSGEEIKSSEGDKVEEGDENDKV